MKTTLPALALTLAASGTALAQAPAGIALEASGDGEAHLALESGNTQTSVRAHVSFLIERQAKDSTEAHKSGWFLGELRIDGKPCSTARGRVEAVGGVARGHAGTSCTVTIKQERPVSVEAVVVKSEGIEREDVTVQLSADYDR
jgi:hypothetical protein